MSLSNGLPHCLDTYPFQPDWLDDDGFEYDDSGEFDDEEFEHNEEPDRRTETTPSSTSSNNKVPLERTRRQATSRRWQSVPVLPDPYLHRFNTSETTTDGNYIRIGIKPPDRLQERPSSTKGTVYKFKIGDHRDNTLSKVPGAICPSTSPGHSDQCKGRVELQGCFIKDSDPRLTPAQHLLKMASRTFINDCSQQIPYGGHFAMALEVKFLVYAPTIFVQIHGMPDHFSYTFPNHTRSFLLPLNIPHDLYAQFPAHGAIIEKGGYPVVTLSIKEIRGDYYVVAQLRSVYAPFTPKSLRCNTRINLSALNRAKCCHTNIQDVSYVYAGKLGRDLSLTGWNRIAFEMKTSRYNATLPTPGHLRLWVNGIMQANSNAFIGRNDAPERGGSGMYHKFGIYRTNSEEPINLQFRNVKTGHGIRDVDARLTVTLPPVNVQDTCFPLATTGSSTTTTAAPNTTVSTTTASPAITAPMINTTATLGNTNVTTPNHTVTPTMTPTVTTTPVSNITLVTMPNDTTISLTNNHSMSPTADITSTPQYGINATHIDDDSGTFKYLFIGSVILNIVFISAISGLLCAIRKMKAQTPKASHRNTRRMIELHEGETELQVLTSPAC